MGGGISAPSVNRLRKTIVIRAHNQRKKDETLEEQFRPFAVRSTATNKLFLSLIDVKKCLNLEDDGTALWSSIEELLCHCAGADVKTQGIEYNSFISFLESGKLPLSKISPTENKENTVVSIDETVVNVRSMEESVLSPPMPPSKLKHKPILRVDTGTTQQIDVTKEESPSPSSSSSSSSKPMLPSPHPYVVEPADTPEARTRKGDSGNGGRSKGDAVFFSGDNNETAIISIRTSSSTGTIQSGKPLWKKKETTKVERTVEYTTIDASGLLQELLESEITETEVFHMECKETGEFAHRETTEFQQKELFNKEVVSEQAGMEEYVHLKSLEDEIEYMESTMPQKQQPPDEQQHEASGNPEEGGDYYTGNNGDGTAVAAEESYEEYTERMMRIAAAEQNSAEYGDEGFDPTAEGMYGSGKQYTHPTVRPAPPRRPPPDSSSATNEYDQDHDGAYDRNQPQQQQQQRPVSSSGDNSRRHHLSVTTEDADADADGEQYQKQHQQRMHLFDPASPVETMPAGSSSHGSNALPYEGAQSGHRYSDGNGDYGTMDDTDTPTSLKAATATTAAAGIKLQTSADEREHEHDELDIETRIGGSQRGPSPSLADID